MKKKSRTGSNLTSWDASFVAEGEMDVSSRSREQKPSRLVKKDGILDLRHHQLAWGNPLYTENAIVLKWVSVLQLVIMTFFGSWLSFALAYWMMEYYNGNLCDTPEDLALCADNNTEKIQNERCVEGIHDFTSALLFSVETMMTIGYGHRALTENCPFIIFIATFQSLFGVLVTGIMTGLLMSKFQMPGLRKNFIWFSREAVVLIRNKRLYLVVKVADQRDNKLRGATITAVMVNRMVTEEGEEITSNIRSLRFGLDKDSDILPFMWPVCVVHEIDSTSPLYHFHPDLVEQQLVDFELLLWVTGTTSSGGLVKARTSYLPSEIIWGGSFNFNSFFQKNLNHITVRGDTSNFHQVEWEQLPRYSAAILEREGVIGE